MPYIPERGDIVWLEFDPQAGHEQKGKRPALVMSGREYNRTTDLFLVCPITSKVKGYPFEVPVNGKIAGVILSDQVKSFDWKARKARFAEKVPKKVLAEVRENIGLLLDE